MLHLFWYCGGKNTYCIQILNDHTQKSGQLFFCLFSWQKKLNFFINICLDHHSRKQRLNATLNANTQAHFWKHCWKVSICLKRKQGNFTFINTQWKRILVVTVLLNTDWCVVISTSVSPRCGKGDNIGSIEAAAVLIYSHFTQVQSYRSRLRGLYAQRGEMPHPGGKNPARDHKKTFSRSASTHSEQEQRLYSDRASPGWQSFSPYLVSATCTCNLVLLVTAQSLWP